MFKILEEKSPLFFPYSIPPHAPPGHGRGVGGRGKRGPDTRPRGNMEGRGGSHSTEGEDKKRRALQRTHFYNMAEKLITSTSSLMLEALGLEALFKLRVWQTGVFFFKLRKG